MSVFPTDGEIDQQIRDMAHRVFPPPNPDNVKQPGHPKCETVTCIDGGQWTGFQFDEAYAYMDALETRCAEQAETVERLRGLLVRAMPWIGIVPIDRQWPEMRQVEIDIDATLDTKEAPHE